MDNNVKKWTTVREIKQLIIKGFKLKVNSDPKRCWLLYAGKLVCLIADNSLFTLNIFKGYPKDLNLPS